MPTDKELQSIQLWDALRILVLNGLHIGEQSSRKDHKVGLAEVEILRLLNSAPQSTLRMRSLAKSALLSRSGIARLVVRLERANLVFRERPADDLRGWNVILTPKGQELITRSRIGAIDRVYERFGKHLDDQDMIDLARVLFKLQSVYRWSGRDSSKALDLPDQESLSSRV